MVSAANPEHPATSSAASGNLLHDVVDALLNPSALWSRLAVSNRVAGCLVLLCIVLALVNWGIDATGVPALEIDRKTQEERARIARLAEGADNPELFIDAMESLEKQGIFSKMVSRVGLVLGGPGYLLLIVGLLPSALFAFIALGGGKANFRTLAAIVAFASWTQVLKVLLRLFLIDAVGASRVETSAAAWLHAPEASLPLYWCLRRCDPFDLWFWVLVWMGLTITGQLSRKSASVIVPILVVLGALLNCALEFSELVQWTLPMEEPQ